MYKRPVKVMLCFQVCFCQLLFAALPVTNGLVMHLDADAITGMSDGAALAAWPDLSGNSYDATQTTAANQPKYYTNVLNGKAVVRFDGVDDWLSLNSSMINVGSFTMFLVGKFDRSTGNDMYLVAGQPTSGDGRLRIASYVSQDRLAVRVGNSSDYYLTDAGDRSTNPHVFAVNSVSNAWMDGIAKGGATNTSTQNPTAFNLGSKNRGEKGFLEGYIAEVVLYNRVLTTTELEQVNLYLNDKYFVTTTTPVTCLYGLPPYDLTGPDGVSDCTVDMYDLSGFAAAWLSSETGMPYDLTGPASGPDGTVNINDFAGIAAVWLSSNDPGYPPVVPRWSYEPWVWEDNTNTQSALLGLVDGYRSRNIPVGGVIIDSPWSTGYNNFIWNLSRYPDPQGMIDQLHANGVRVVMWMTGNVNRTSTSEVPLTKSSNYDEAVANGYGLIDPTEFSWWKGTGIHVDVTNPQARQWFASELDKVMDMGIDGFKCDEGVAYLPEEVTTSTGLLSGANYRLLWYDYMADYATNKNPAAVITARPYSWQHGYHARVSKCILGWCGDFKGDYSGITFQMDNLYQSAQAGYSGLQVEVGGYWQTAPSKSQLIRYAQFGAMMPSMSNGGSNGGLTNHLPWWQDQQVGGGSTETTDIYRYFATLHSELVPFLFSLGVEAHLTGQPIVRQTDITMGQHMLGDDILVGVMSSDYQKTLHLPAGQWINFWDRSSAIAGDQTLSLNLPLNRYPIYIRNGAIIPMNVRNGVTGHGDSASEGKITILIFPHGLQAKTFYCPNGDGIEYTPIDITVAEGNGTIQVNSPTTKDWIIRVQVAAAPTAVTGADSWSYDPTAKVIVIHKSGNNFEITVEGLSAIDN